MLIRFTLPLLIALTLLSPVHAQDKDTAGQLAALEARVTELEAMNAILIDRLLGLESADAGPFVDRVREALMTDPGMLFDAVDEYDRQQVAAQIEVYGDELSGDAYLPVLGNPDGDITLVEYFDYNCGYCRRAMEDVLALVEADGNIRLVLKEFPILSEQSQEAALMAIAAAQEGVDYLTLHRLAMTSGGTVDGNVILQNAALLGGDIEAIEARLAANEQSYLQSLLITREVTNALGITGTPAFFIDGQVIPGAVSRGQLENTIAEIRAARDEG